MPLMALSGVAIRRIRAPIDYRERRSGEFTISRAMSCRPTRYLAQRHCHSLAFIAAGGIRSKRAPVGPVFTAARMPISID